MKIRIAAAVIMRSDGATLLVRKRGTSTFMQPGGKIDGNESPLEALQRELLEELGLSIRPDEAEYLGNFRAPAANEPASTVTADLFRVVVNERVQVQAEIEEARWVDANSCRDLELAPLTAASVLPLIWNRC